jgi:cytochrome c peroxidase
VRGADCSVGAPGPGAWAALILSSATVMACGAGAAGAPADAGAGDGALTAADGAPRDAAPASMSSDGEAGDIAPTFTAAERAALGDLSPATLPASPPDVSNRWADDATAAAFGQKLFFEAGFSGPLLEGDDDGSPATLGVMGQTGKVACAGCHQPAAGYLDDRSTGKQISLAAGWGKRRAPSLLDVGQARLLMWDGRHDALYNQPFGPLESPVEMNSSRLYAAEQIYARYRSDYEAIFGSMPAFDDVARFPPLSAALTGCQPSTADAPSTCDGTEHGMPGDHAEFDAMAPEDQAAVTRVVVNMGKALGAYERKLACGPGRFDAWVHGQSDALSPSEQRGAQLFVGKGNCVGCHSGPYLSDQSFHNVGLQPAAVAVVFIDANDPGALTGLAGALSDPLNVAGVFSDGNDGRLPATVVPKMNGAFRTPILRCVSQRPSLLHTGQLATLGEVVAFFAQGGDSFGYPGTSELAPLSLGAQDQADLVAFLGTLDGPGAAANLRESPP